MATSLSIIIPTFQRQKELGKAIDSLIPQLSGDSELIVVDQGKPHSDFIIEITGRHSQIKYFFHKTPNLPGARNKGIQKSAGDIVLFMDDDALAQSGLLQAHIKAHQKTKVGAVAGRIKQMVKTRQWDKTEKVAEINSITGETSGNFDLDWEGEVAYASGGNMSIKRSVFEKIGGFNSRYQGNALFEEVDFFCRLRKAGHIVYYCPQAEIHHRPPDYGGCWTDQGVKYYLDRLHNHTLFYLLNIRLLPSFAFLKTAKNLAEYLSRKNKPGSLSDKKQINSGHSLPLLLLSAWTFARATFHFVQTGVFGNKL